MRYVAQKMKLLLLLSLFLSLSSCSDRKTTTPADPSPYEEQFADWNAGVQAQLEEGRSWVLVDHDLVAPLAKDASNNLGFLTERLEKNMFVYQILDTAPGLRGRFGVPEFSGSVNEHQQAWLKALRRSE